MQDWQARLRGVETPAALCEVLAACEKELILLAVGGGGGAGCRTLSYCMFVGGRWGLDVGHYLTTCVCGGGAGCRTLSCCMCVCGGGGWVRTLFYRMCVGEVGAECRTLSCCMWGWWSPSP